MLTLRRFFLLLVFTMSFLSLSAQVNFNGVTIASGEVYYGEVHSTSDIPTLVNYPAHGNFVGFYPQGSGNYSFTYTPDADYTGIDQFTIQVKGPATSYLTYEFSIVPSIVTPKNDYANVLVNGTAIGRNVIGNDYASHPPLTLKEIIFEEGGTATINGDLIQFIPEAGYTGMAHVRYTACDTKGTCGTGLFTVSVLDGESIILNLDLGTTKNTSVVAPLDWVGYSIETNPSNGTAQINDLLELEYTPNQDFFGEDYFTISNGQVTKQVSVEVFNTYEANSVALLDIVYTPVNTPVSFNVLDNDKGNYVVMGYSQPGHGTLVYNGAGNFTYSPIDNYTSGLSFTYQVGDPNNPNVETGTVELLIGNQNPTKGSFELTTSAGLPLVIKYPTTFTEFGFEEILAPNNGYLEYYEGEQTILLGGKAVSGNNMLVYFPNDGFTGTDKFDINYCLAANDDCKEIKIQVDVVDAPATCFDECIWPGDANADGVVNAQDLLTIGLFFGQSGPARTDNSTDWYAHEGENWNNAFGDTDLKHCDTNGDGKITAADTVVVSAAYAKNDNLTPYYPTAHKSINISFGEPSIENPQAGDFVSIPLILGSETYPAIDIFGFTYNIYYWVDAFEEGAYIEFNEESFLTQNDAVLNIAKAPYNGRLESALTRTGNTAASGYGIIGTLNFVIDDEIDGIKSNGGKIDINIQGGSVSNTQGQNFGIINGGMTLQLNLAGTGQAEIDANQVIVYPNPAQEEINIHLNGGFIANKIEIMNMQGQKIFSVRNLDTNHFVYPLTDIMPGVYIAKVSTIDGVVFKRFSVVRN